MTALKSVRPGGARVVLIGIDRYQDESRHAPLGWCVSDALAIYWLLTDPARGGVDADCVSLLLGHKDREKGVELAATRLLARLQRTHGVEPRPGAIKTLLAKRQPPRLGDIVVAVDQAARAAGPDDLLLVQASCHSQVADGEVYLVPYEAKAGYYPATALKLRDLKKLLADSKARHKLLILDVCFGGVTSTTTTNDQARSTLRERAGELHLLASCSPGEFAQEDDGHEHGAFTACLLDGLWGAAESSGYVTLEAAFHHARQLLERRTQQGHAAQTPILDGPDAASIVLNWCPKVAAPSEAPALPAGPNPFVWRGRINEASAFFNRDSELKEIRNFVVGKQNCQLVGPYRIGKSSLLNQVKRAAPSWFAGPVSVAYLDLQGQQCATLAGWLRQVGKQLGLDPQPTSMSEFEERVQELLDQDASLILCMDGFRSLAERPHQFASDFFMSLRTVGQCGLSILTCSQQRLAELTNPAYPSSPFYNHFTILRLGVFSQDQATAFVRKRRPDVPSFSQEEEAAILGCAMGHPLALQIACYCVLQAKYHGHGLTGAIAEARDQIRNAEIPWPPPPDLRTGIR